MNQPRLRPLYLVLTAFSILLLLAAVSGLWLRSQQQQYARNRQLIAALEHEDGMLALDLINAGADPNTPQTSPPTPTIRLLFDHLLHRSPSPVTMARNALMMVCGDNWYTRTRRDYTPCHLPENLPLIAAMLAHGANVQAHDMDGWTALHYAALDGRLGTIELLVEHGANVNAQDEVGDTGLGFSIQGDHLAVTRMLLTYGANPNVQDENGDTPLHYAVESDGNASTLCELLSHGADPNVVNQSEGFPLTLARQKKRADLLVMLRSGGKQP